MQQNNSYILTGPIRTGKTTALMNWCNAKQNVGGLLMPDVNEVRKLYAISTMTTHDFEVGIADERPCMEIGRFRFLESSFALGNQLICDAANGHFNFVVIDEIGKLELKEEGFHSGLAFALQRLNTNLLLVVRDSLLQEVMVKYNLMEAKTITKEQLHELH